MRLRKVLLTVATILMVSNVSAQRPNRSNVCQDIPNLTQEQNQEINKLSVAHQKKMDDLRTKFWSEPDPDKASVIKIQMNTEMDNHYRNISNLLTSEQKTWYDQNCNVNRRYYYGRRGYGRNGQGLGRGRGNGRGRGYGRGGGYGRGQGNGPGGGRGRRAFTN